MATETLTYTGELVILRCWCGIRHAVPDELRKQQRRQQDLGQPVTSVYCPLGHTHIPAGKSEAQKERERAAEAERALARRVAQLDQERAARKAAERRAAARKGALTRAQNRAKAGLCPVQGCKRGFKQLRDHLEDCHPGYSPPAVP